MRVVAGFPWRSRLLIDYCQFLTERALLPRGTPGAAFLGCGDKYWSVVDDPEIELLKALWEGEDYLRIPTARRVWGTDWCSKEETWKLACVCAACAQSIVSNPDQHKDHLIITDFRRGVWMAIMAMSKQWKSIRVMKWLPLAREQFLYFFIEGKRVKLIQETVKWEPQP